MLDNPPQVEHVQVVKKPDVFMQIFGVEELLLKPIEIMDSNVKEFVIEKKKRDRIRKLLRHAEKTLSEAMYLFSEAMEDQYACMTGEE